LSLRGNPFAKQSFKACVPKPEFGNEVTEVARRAATLSGPAAFLFLTPVIFLGIRLAGVIIYPEEEFQLAEQNGF
jgi:hypothetical protein